MSDFFLFAVHANLDILSVATVYGVGAFVDLWFLFLITSGTKWKWIAGWLTGFYLIEFTLIQYITAILNSGVCLLGISVLVLLPQIIKNSRGSDKRPSFLLTTALLTMNSMPFFLLSCFQGHLILACTILCLALSQLFLSRSRVDCRPHETPFDYKTPVPQLKTANQIVVENAVQPGEIVCCHCFNPVNLHVWPVRWTNNTDSED